MKKSIIILFLQLVSIVSFAQVNFSIKAGAGFGSSVDYQKNIIDSEITKVSGLEYSPAFSYSFGPNIKYNFN